METFLGIDWKALSFIVAILTGWTMLLVKIIAWLLKRALGTYDDQMAKLEKDIANEAKKRSEADKNSLRKYEKLDQDFRHFLADLPKQYVQREDWIRTWTAVDAKLDSVWRELMGLNKGQEK